ncbi:MAG: ATP phosphoribosyltransferase regulatory subunit [Pseudomonadota bacterium]
MSITSEDLSLAQNLVAGFQARGAARVEAAILQPADTLLDLYGEDIRARAYTTADPLRGEQMLRPDFTVPVVQMHMQASAMPARYTYVGPVFRRQEMDETRAHEYLQAGYEVFDTDRAAADAEVLAAIIDALGPAAGAVVIGDLGVLMSAVQALPTSDARKNALSRHLWRPKRFETLLARFCGDSNMSASHAALLSPDWQPSEAEQIGKRQLSEIEARRKRLLEDRDTPSLPPETAQRFEDLLKISGRPHAALKDLRALGAKMPGLDQALDRFRARLDAFEAAGIDLSALAFDASHGRDSMEYYDGFVFSVFGKNADRFAAPLATGGRYDALTTALGGGQDIPAVGGVVRPSDLREALSHD